MQSGRQPRLAAGLGRRLAFSFCAKFCKEMQKPCTGSVSFLTTFQDTKPNGNRGAAEFSQSEWLVFLVVFVKRRKRMESVPAIWSKAFSPAFGGCRLHFSSCERLRWCNRKHSFRPFGAGLKTAFLSVAETNRPYGWGGKAKVGIEAAYTALTWHHSAGLSCQAMIADSRHPTRPGEIRTGLGNCPLLITRQRVVREKEVTSSTSLSRMKRSSLLTLGSYDLSLCETPKLTDC